jgi:aarF domain-containing kinase
VLQQRWLEPQMVLLDVGMATELTEEDQRNMIGLFRSFAAMDGKACGEWTLKFSGGVVTQYSHISLYYFQSMLWA